MPHRIAPVGRRWQRLPQSTDCRRGALRTVALAAAASVLLAAVAAVLLAAAAAALTFASVAGLLAPAAGTIDMNQFFGLQVTHGTIPSWLLDSAATN
jgi:hypothetical protein